MLLALECQSEALLVQKGTRRRLQEEIDRGIEDADPKRRRVTAEALLTRRLRQMYALNKQTFLDTSFVTCAEYQLFLDEQALQKKYGQAGHWTNHRFPASQGKAPVLGILGTDAQAFCEWLSQRESGVWRYRLPCEEDFGSIDQHRWKGPPQQMGYWVEGERRFIWSQKKPPSSARALMQDFLNHIPAADRNRACEAALALAHTLTSGPLEKCDLDRALTLLRTRDLDRALTLACISTCDLGLGHILDRALDSYIQALLLQGRRVGQLPAYEGILLVKERQL